MKTFLHPLVNRGSGFVWPRFPIDPHWVSRESVSAARVREVAGLKTYDSDWYAVGCLQAMAGVPWIAREVGNVAGLADLLHYTPTPGHVEGAVLIPDQKGPPALVRTSMVWPVDFVMVLQRVDAACSHFTVDGVKSVIRTRLTGDSLQVDWPTTCGVSGALTVPSWVSSERVTIHQEPRRFPYELLPPLLEKEKDHARLLLVTGLSGAYTAGRSTLEKVAVTSLALIMDYNAHG